MYELSVNNFRISTVLFVSSKGPILKKNTIPNCKNMK